MARIRTIKPSFFKHETLYDAERASGLPLRIAFAGLWTVADREGRFAWRPRTIKTDVLPHDDCDFEEVMNSLEKFGFVERYVIDGETFGHIPSFCEHQRVNSHEPLSSLPAPANPMPACAMPMQAPAKNGHASREGKGTEGNGKEGNESQFDIFWNLCPKKIGRGKTRRFFNEAIRNVSQETLTRAMARYAQSRIGQDEKFTLHPATWLSEERWLDDWGDATPRPRVPPHESWGGHAAMLIAEMGEAVFAAYFASAVFVIGPPVIIRVATPMLRELIARKYAGALRKTFGPIQIEVTE